MSTEDQIITILNTDFNDMYIFYDGKDENNEQIYKNKYETLYYNDFYQGDLYEYEINNKKEYYVLMNQTCDLTNNIDDIKKIILLKAENINDYIFNENGLVGKSKRDSFLPSIKQLGDEITLNFDINKKDRCILSKNSLIDNFLVLFFSNIISLNKEEFINETKNQKYLKICTISTPYLENITRKFGDYYGRVAIPEYVFKI